jgi:hypothetical protein
VPLLLPGIDRHRPIGLINGALHTIAATQRRCDLTTIADAKPPHRRPASPATVEISGQLSATTLQY